jgi:hypothetical protein
MLPEVDIVSAWAVYHWTFASWLMATGLPLRLFLVHWLTRLSLVGSIASALALNGLAVLFAVIIPLGAIGPALVPLPDDWSFRVDWILVFLATVLIVSGLETLVLLRWRHGTHRRLYWSLVLVNAACLAFAANRTVAYMDEHPGEAADSIQPHGIAYADTLPCRMTRTGCSAVS